MKYASEDLIHEHVAINEGLDVLERMARRLTEGNTVDRADAADLVGFFVEFADKCHHGKEEGILFPAMAEAGIPNENGPIGVMLAEHVQGRAAIAKMKTALADSAFEAAAFVEGADAYLALLRTHIRKENMILFPLGDKRIPEELEAGLLERFEQHEATVMGPGAHDRLHALLHRLQQTYIGGESK